MGLAWTSHGGSTLYIETIKQKRRQKSKTDVDDADVGSGKIEFTGKHVFCSLVLTQLCGHPNAGL